MSGWISAAEMLPEANKCVLCVKRLKNGRLDMCFGSYNPDGMEWDYENNRPRTGVGRWSTSGSNNNVIWWMKLPELPEGDA